MTVKSTFTLEELVGNANCQRGTYNPDFCVTHKTPWFAYDEEVCWTVLKILGCRKPRIYLGDGRARGNPILPRR